LAPHLRLIIVDRPQQTESIMKPNTVRVLGVTILAAVALAAVAQPTVKPQIQVAPSYIPIGVATRGNASTAWFHNPSSGMVLACQSAAGTGATLSGIQCVTARLP
jgi:hypothetical protein